MEELLHEMDMIVASGTKVNIDYYLEDNVDEYSREDIYEYFMEADTDSVDEAFATEITVLFAIRPRPYKEEKCSYNCWAKKPWRRSPSWAAV